MIFILTPILKLYTKYECIQNINVYKKYLYTKTNIFLHTCIFVQTYIWLKICCIQMRDFHQCFSKNSTWKCHHWFTVFACCFVWICAKLSRCQCHLRACLVLTSYFWICSSVPGNLCWLQSLLSEMTQSSGVGVQRIFELVVLVGFGRDMNQATCLQNIFSFFGYGICLEMFPMFTANSQNKSKSIVIVASFQYVERLLALNR